MQISLLEVCRVILVISYVAGPIFIAVQEFKRATTSRHFRLPVALVYLVSVVQFGCAIALLSDHTAMWAALVLTGTTLGALGSHLRIGSAKTSVPAIVYSLLQIWFATQLR